VSRGTIKFYKKSYGIIIIILLQTIIYIFKTKFE